MEEFRFVEVDGEDHVPICSVIPGNEMRALKVEPGKEYRKERVAWKMNAERVVSQYEEVVFEAEGQPILASVPHYWENEHGERIVFFYSDGRGE